MDNYCRKLNIPRKTLLYCMKVIPELETMRKLGNGDLEKAESIYGLFLMKRNLRIKDIQQKEYRLDK